MLADGHSELTEDSGRIVAGGGEQRCGGGAFRRLAVQRTTHCGATGRREAAGREGHRRVEVFRRASAAVQTLASRRLSARQGREPRPALRPVLPDGAGVPVQPDLFLTAGVAAGQRTAERPEETGMSAGGAGIAVGGRHRLRSPATGRDHPRVERPASDVAPRRAGARPAAEGPRGHADSGRCHADHGHAAHHDRVGDEAPWPDRHREVAAAHALRGRSPCAVADRRDSQRGRRSRRTGRSEQDHRVRPAADCATTRWPRSSNTTR